MKTLLTISTLLFTVMFSSSSFAGWTKLGENSLTTYYVDFERLRKVDGYVYYWDLKDLLKPTHGTLSLVGYNQGDCKLFRFKMLSSSSHKEPMGSGTVKESNASDSWTYPRPDSIFEDILKSVCSR